MAYTSSKFDAKTAAERANELFVRQVIQSTIQRQNIQNLQQLGVQNLGMSATVFPGQLGGYAANTAPGLSGFQGAYPGITTTFNPDPLYYDGKGDRVAIIMPVYNNAPYLAEAIRSCLATNCDELVIIDDCSTDSSMKIAEFYKKDNPKINLLKTKKNGGPAMAMNLGMSKSGADIFMFAAGDDIQLPEKVKIGLEALNGGYQIGYSGYHHCNPKGEEWEYCPPANLTAVNIRKNKCASGGALAIRREVFLKTPFRDIPFNEDHAFLVDAFKAGYRWNYINKPTFKYRLLKTGLSYAHKDEIGKLVEEINKELDDETA